MTLDKTSLPSNSTDNTNNQITADLDMLCQTLPLGEQCNHNGLGCPGNEAHRQPSAVSEAPGCDGLPSIQVNDRPLRTLIAGTMTAIRLANDPPSIFSYGDRLARVLTPSDAPPTVRSLSLHALLGVMTARADYVRVHQDHTTQAFPPILVAEVLLTLESYPGLPALDGITPIPVLLPDGALLDRPGYHAPSRLFYAPARDLHIPPIPPAPTQSDVQRAAAWLIEELFQDFPLVLDDPDHPTASSSLANCLALLVTPFVRSTFRGCVPLACITAPKPGSGKTLLAAVISTIFTGGEAAIRPALTTEDEWRKQGL
jgi:hypothetical protein